MSTIQHLVLVQPYLDSVELERCVLRDVLLAEGLDPLRPLVGNGVSVSNVGHRRTYLLASRILVRFHFEQYLVAAVELPGRPISRLAWSC